MGKRDNAYDQFEADLEEVLGERIRSGDEACAEMWSALANIIWLHPDFKHEVGYTFRSAGGLIAEIVGEGDYMNWYCSGPDETVSDHISSALETKGWSYKSYDLVN